MFPFPVDFTGKGSPFNLFKYLSLLWQLYGRLFSLGMYNEKQIFASVISIVDLGQHTHKHGSIGMTPAHWCQDKNIESIRSRYFGFA